MASPVSILIGDDHALMRQGMRRILEEQPGWTVVGEAGDGRQVVTMAEELLPTVVIVDISMPQLSGIEATRQVVRRLPKPQVLIVSMHADDAHLVQALRAGARGYLLKESAGSELVQAVACVAVGKSYFSPAVASLMLDGYVRQLTDKGVVGRYDALSAREREILQLIAEGRTSKDVATLLGVSPTTVDTHRAHLMRKLGVHTVAELVLFAVRCGLVA